MYRRSSLRFGLLLLPLSATTATAQDFLFSSGNFVPNVTAPQPLQAGDTLQINAGGNKIFSGVTFTNLGQVDWNADPLFLQSDARINNQGLWRINGDFTFINNGGAVPVFTNTGILRKTAGSSAAGIGGIAFVNSGIIDVLSGTLDFNGGNASFDDGTSFTGSGSSRIVSNATFNGGISSANLVFAGGTAFGNAAVLSGAAGYTGGVLSGTWSTAAGHTLTALDGGNKVMSGLAFTNLGTLDWSSTNTLFMQSGAQFDNQGRFQASENMAIVNNGGALPGFTNNGVFAVAAGKTVSMGSVAFVNNGTLDVAGTLSLDGHNASFNAGSSFTGSGVVAVNSNASFNGAITASPTLSLRNGIFTGGSTFSIGGNPEWTGGVMTGQWTVAAGEALVVHDGGNKIMSALALTNLGTLDWDSTNTLFMQSGAQFDNQGRFQASENMAIVNNGGALPGFTNNGVFAVAAGKTVSMGTLAFVNNGSIDVAGTLSLDGHNATLNAGSTFTGSGVVAVNSNASFKGAITASPTLSLRNGAFTGANDFTIGGNPEWLGGVMTGQWTIAAGHTLTARDGGNKVMSGLALTNLGTVDWNTTNTLFMQSDAQFDNQGRFQASENMAIVNNGGALPGFTNNGVFAVAAGKTVSMGSVAFVNNGSIDVAGTLSLDGHNATFNAGSTFTGSGVVAVNSNASFKGAITASPTLSLRNGTFTGASDFAIGGNPEWLGGVMTGQWTIAAGHTLTARDGGNKVMNALALTNLGTLDWDSTNTLFMQSGTEFDNQGLFRASANMAIANQGGNLPRFTNNGVFAVAAGKTVSMGSVAFVNNGSIDVAGTLSLDGHNATFNAGSTFTGSGVVAVNSNATFNGAITASPTLSLRNGTFTGANDFAIGGNPEWLGGVMTGQWTVAAGHTFTARDGGNKVMNALAFTNLGTLAWETTNTLFVQSGSQLANKGTIDSKTDHAFQFNGGSVGSFVNEGLIVKSGGNGTTSIGNGLGFVNAAAGVIDVRSGTIALPSNFTNDGTLMGTGSFATNVLTNSGHVAPGASPGTLAISGSYLQTAIGTLDIELESLASADLLKVSGSSTLAGTLALHCYGNCVFQVGDELTVLDGIGELLGQFDAIAYFGFGSGEFDVVYDRVKEDVILRAVTATSPVPLPAPVWLLLGGIGVLTRRTRR